MELVCCDTTIVEALKVSDFLSGECNEFVNSVSLCLGTEKLNACNEMHMHFTVKKRVVFNGH